MFNLFKKQVTTEELAAGFYLVIQNAMSSPHPLWEKQEILTKEQKAILVLACFDKIFKKYEVDKKVMGVLVAIFVKEFYQKIETVDIGVEMLAIFDKIIKLNSFWEIKPGESAENFTKRQLGESFPFNINKDATKRMLVLQSYMIELKMVDKLIIDTMKKFKIVIT